LALGVEGVERQRGLARTGDAGEGDELALRQDQLVDVEIVFVGAGDDDLVGFLRSVRHFSEALFRNSSLHQ